MRGGGGGGVDAEKKECVKYCSIRRGFKRPFSC